MAVELAITRLPGIRYPPSGIANAGTVVGGILATIALLCSALLGIRYPVKMLMLPLLYFALLWKVLWVLGWGIPLWSAGQLTPDSEQTLISAVVGVVLVPLAIPRRYAFSQYVQTPGDRSGQRASVGTRGHGREGRIPAGSLADAGTIDG